MDKEVRHDVLGTFLGLDAGGELGDTNNKGQLLALAQLLKLKKLLCLKHFCCSHGGDDESALQKSLMFNLFALLLLLFLFYF